MVHLVYIDNAGKSGEKVKDKIMNNTKTMIVRGAAGRKIPHSRVFENEVLYFLEKGSKEFFLKATVSSVQNFIKLSESETEQILKDNQKYLNLTDKQYERWFKKCLCLVAFKNLEILKHHLFLNIKETWMIG